MRTVKVRILPPQPIFFRQRGKSAALILRGRQTRIQPAFPAAVHGFDVGVAHFLQVVRHQRGTKTAAAVQYDLGAGIRHALLDVALDDALAQMHCAGKMAFGPFIVFAHIHQEKFLPRLDSTFHVSDVGFLHFLFRFIDEFQELRRVGHGKTPSSMDWDESPRITQTRWHHFRCALGSSGTGEAHRGRNPFFPIRQASIPWLLYCSFLANERTRFTKFQRTFSFVRSPSPGIFPLPLLMIQKSSPSVTFSREEASRQSRSSSFMSAARSPLPSPAFPWHMAQL